MDPTVSYLQKVLSFSVEDAPSFNNPHRQATGGFSRILFVLAGQALQPVQTMTFTYQIIADWSRAIRRHLNTMAIDPFGHVVFGAHVHSLELQCG